MKRGFTLMELLIVILIIGLLAGLSVAALAGAAEQARASRTKSIIAKLDQLIGAKWDSYQTRTLPIRTTGARGKSEPFSDTNGNGFWDSGETFTDQPITVIIGGVPTQVYNSSYDYGSGYLRLMAMREMMRMELPDRRTDVVNYTVAGSRPPESTFTGMPNAALQRQYWRKAVVTLGGDPQVAATTACLDNWSEANQGAECLYLIVSAMHDGDKNAMDFFSPSEIGDTDEDGMREILDGWGRPIHFLRWAPAYTRESVVGSLTPQVSAVDPTTGRPLHPDSLDPVREDARATYDLRPLILSAGRDGVVNVAFDFQADPTYRATSTRNDPYHIPASPDAPLGTAGLGGLNDWADNITNHWQEP